MALAQIEWSTCKLKAMQPGMSEHITLCSPTVHACQLDCFPVIGNLRTALIVIPISSHYSVLPINHHDNPLPCAMPAHHFFMPTHSCCSCRCSAWPPCDESSGSTLLDSSVLLYMFMVYIAVLGSYVISIQCHTAAAAPTRSAVVTAPKRLIE